MPSSPGGSSASARAPSTATRQATGLAVRRHHETTHAVSHSARRECDLGFLPATLTLTHRVPGGVAWVASTTPSATSATQGGLRRHLPRRRDLVATAQASRFELNCPALGIVVPIPFRADRDDCLPVLWRLRRTGRPGHQPRPRAAAALARKPADANLGRTFWPVGDGSYVKASLLQGRQENLQVIGPLRWKAALFGQAAPRAPKQRGPSRKKGERLPDP